MEQSSFVTEDDLEHLCRLVEEKDGGPVWIQMMDRSTPTMAYQAWRRDPEVDFSSLLFSSLQEILSTWVLFAFIIIIIIIICKLSL